MAKCGKCGNETVCMHCALSRCDQSPVAICGEVF